MGRLPYTYLLIFYCFTFVCIYGGGQESSPSCEVELLVRRGMTWKVAPQQRLTVKCPVKHCGESVNVTWCKLLEADKCEQINPTENVKITQDEEYAVDKLTSYLTFKWISIHDDGLYRCNLLGDVVIAHPINISVSDLHQGSEYSDYDHAASHQKSKNSESNNRGNLNLSWLPYFYICISAVLLVTTFTVLTLLRFYGWKRILSFYHNKGEETSTHMIPDLPKNSNHSALSLQTHIPHLMDIPSPTTVGPSQPPMMTSGNQSAVAVVETQASDHAVYAVINHRKSGLPAREQHTANKQNKNAEYAVINFS